MGDRVRLARVTELVEFDLDALVYLDSTASSPAAEATVVARGPDGSLVLEVGEDNVVLGASLAALLFVAPAPAPAQASCPARL